MKAALCGSMRAVCHKASCGCRLTCRPRPGPAATPRGRTLPVGRGIGAPTPHGARRQVDLEILLGEMGSSRSFGHFGDQGAPVVGTLLAGVAILIGRIGDGGGDRPAGVLLTLRHQLQRTLGARSTAMAALWPSKRWLRLLRPWRISGSCTDTMRSRLTPCSRRVLAGRTTS